MKAIHAVVLSGAALTACVPTGSAPPYDAGPAPAAIASFRPSLNIMTAPFEDNFDRPDSGEPPTPWPAFEGGVLTPTQDSATVELGAREAGVRKPGQVVGEVFRALTPPADAMGPDAEDGSPAAALGDRGLDRSNLGPAWMQVKTRAWRVEDGKLCVQNAHNHGIWLNRTLPVNARIEFDATGYTDDGDLKAEVGSPGTELEFAL